MEVEVKLRLPSSRAHRQVADLLASSHKISHLQENVFFDGTNSELSSKRAVLRLRFYNGDSNCVVSLKGQAVLVDGISRVEEVEEDVDVALARACLAEPWRLSLLDSDLVRKVMSDYHCNEFVCLGGFRNVRNVFDWQGEVLELDETQFDFGTCYEIECETTDPEKVRRLLENFLNENAYRRRRDDVAAWRRYDGMAARPITFHCGVRSSDKHSMVNKIMGNDYWVERMTL